MSALSYYTGVDTSAGIRLELTRTITRRRVAPALLSVLLAAGILPATALAQPPSPPPDSRPAQGPPGKGPGPAAPAEGVIAFPGGVVWEAALPGSPAHRPAFDDRRMFVALKDDTLVAVTLETGAIAWTQPQASTAPPGVMSATLVGADGTSLWARDAATGAPRWTRTVDADALPNYVSQIGATAAAACLTTAAGTLSCVKPEDGSPLWQQALGAKPTAGPVVAAGRVAVGFADGRVRAFAIDTGAPLWTRSATGAILTLTATNSRVIAGTDANVVYVFDAAKGKQKWKWRTGGDPVGEAIVVGKRLYYLAYDNMLRAHNLRNGHMAWSRVLASRPVGGPVAIGDRVLVASVAPQLRAFKVTDGTPDGVVALLGKVIHPPQFVAAAGDVPPMLVVLTGGGQMQAIGQTIEPAVVPLETLPGTRLIPETLKR
jgi:hypothetical protein